MLKLFTDTDRDLLQQVSQCFIPHDVADLDEEVLRDLSENKGVDFATAWLFQTICSSAGNASFVNRMNEILEDTAASAGSMRGTFVVAPGAFYREHPETGADGRRLCNLAGVLGCRTHVISTHSTGCAAANGRIICDWLLNHPERNTILCSLSKGGADVKMALAEHDAPEVFRNVVAWINVGGITSGSPMATWLLERPWLTRLYQLLFWCRGQDFAFVREMQRGFGSALDFDVVPPRHMRILHVLAFPLARHVAKRPTRCWHRRLSRYGPNDGATILADSCRIPGLIFPVWGADHYLDSVVRPEVLLQALLRYLADDLRLHAASPRITVPEGSAAS
jgi:hypothetical protein